jgi:hypothetical protein
MSADPTNSRGTPDAFTELTARVHWLGYNAANAQSS